MKKWTSVLLAALFMLVIAGCQTGETASTINKPQNANNEVNNPVTWLYYRDINQDDAMCRMHLDGSNQETLAKVKTWNATLSEDGWIFFLNKSDTADFTDNADAPIYRIKTNGSDMQKICADRCQNLCITGEWVFFKNDSDLAYSGIHSGKLYRVKTDGSDKQRIFNDTVSSHRVTADRLYFTSVTEDNLLYSSSLDGSGQTSLGVNRVGIFRTSNDWIYYIKQDEGHSLYRIKTDGTGNQKLNDDPTISGMVVDGDYVYFMVGNEATSPLYRVKTDGSEKKELTSELVSDIEIYDGVIYYANANDGDRLYKMNLDGSQPEKISETAVSMIGIAPEETSK